MASKFTTLTKKNREETGACDCSWCGTAFKLGQRVMLAETGNFCSRNCQRRHTESTESFERSDRVAEPVPVPVEIPFGCFGSPEMRETALRSLSARERSAVEAALSGSVLTA